VATLQVTSAWLSCIHPRFDPAHDDSGGDQFGSGLVHATAIVAADFVVAMTAGFRVLYVFVVMEVGSRRILHCNVTAHPTAAWTLQQFREAIPSDDTYRFLIHDRDSIFSAEVDDDLGAFGLKILRTRAGAEGQCLL